jgi:hypothetical protein
MPCQTKNLGEGKVEWWGRKFKFYYKLHILNPTKHNYFSIIIIIIIFHL